VEPVTVYVNVIFRKLNWEIYKWFVKPTFLKLHKNTIPDALYQRFPGSEPLSPDGDVEFSSRGCQKILTIETTTTKNRLQELNCWVMHPVARESTNTLIGTT
jgi:hypothetical protein